jgi:hypothetical protein
LRKKRNTHSFSSILKLSSISLFAFSEIHQVVFLADEVKACFYKLTDARDFLFLFFLDFNPGGSNKYFQVVGINGTNHLAFGPDSLEEGEVFSFCLLAFFSSLHKIGSDGQKQKELCEDEHYQYKVDRSHNISLQL